MPDRDPQLRDFATDPGGKMEPIHPDDAIAHGQRWRQERDWAFELLKLYVRTGKPRCLHPDLAGSRCCECAACQAQPIPTFDDYLSTGHAR